MVANDSTLAARNTAVLETIINIAQTTDCLGTHPFGAIILFPGHEMVPPQGGDGHDRGAEYFLQAPGDGTAAINVDCNWPLRFLGTGDSELTMNIPTGSTSGDMFSLATGGGGRDRAVRDLIVRAGVTPVTLHGLRDTHASLCAKAGVPLEVVGRRLGHASIEVTAERYFLVYSDRDADAADAFGRLVG
jgi:Phage integrase family